MQIDQKTLGQTGFKGEVTEKLVSLFSKKRKVYQLIVNQAYQES